MIVQEFYTTRSDGVRLIRTYSDLNFYIQDNNYNIYTEAIDPETLGRQYHEIPISINNVHEQEQEHQIEELQEAIQILLGNDIGEQQ